MPLEGYPQVQVFQRDMCIADWAVWIILGSLGLSVAETISSSMLPKALISVWGFMPLL